MFYFSWWTKLVRATRWYNKEDSFSVSYCVMVTVYFDHCHSRAVNPNITLHKRHTHLWMSD